MKKIPFLIFITVILSIGRLAAQNKSDTSAPKQTNVPVYIIDGEVIENFDGSQLTGKKIVNYKIIDLCDSIYGTKQSTQKKHIIYTDQFHRKSMADNMPGELNAIGLDPKNNHIDNITIISPEKKPGYGNIGKHVIIVNGETVHALPAGIKISNILIIKDKNHPEFKKYVNESERDITSLIMVKTR